MAITGLVKMPNILYGYDEPIEFSWGIVGGEYGKEKIEIDRLEGEYFKINNNLELEPSDEMISKMNKMISNSSGNLKEEDKENIRKAMIDKLFTSKKPNVSKERAIMNEMVYVIKSCQESLTALMEYATFLIYGAEGYVFDYIYLLLKKRTYDVVGKSYEEREMHEKLEEAQRIIDIKTIEIIHSRLKRLSRRIIDNEISNKLLIIKEQLIEIEKIANSLDYIKSQANIAAKLGYYEIDLQKIEDYIDASEVKDLIKDGLDSLIKNIQERIDREKNKEYSKIEDAINQLGVFKEEGLSFDEL